MPYRFALSLCRRLAPRRGAGTVLLGLLLTAAAQAAPLTLAVAHSPGFAPVLIADAEGYFAAEGLEIKMLRAINGKRALQHLLDGEAQLATVADTPIVMASFARREHQVIATLTTSVSENKVVARADRGIRTPADLKGKRIGVVRGTSGHYFADRYLLYHGVDRSTVTLVALDPADPVGPLARGEVDAVGSYEPFGHKARKALGTQALFLPVPRMFNVSFNLVVRRGSLRADELQKVLRAVQRAEQLIVAEPARARAILSARTGLEPSLIHAVWPDYHFALGLDQSLLALFEAQARWARREGLIGPGLPDMDFLDFVDPRPLQALERRRVTLLK